ncbi:transposase [Paraburkholderia sp. A2RO-4L]
MARVVWNLALAEQRARHTRGEQYASYASMCQWLTTWRNDPAHPWMSEAPVHTQQQVLRRLDQTFKKFFDNVKAGKKPGFPRFKKKGLEPGLRFPDKKHLALDAGNGRIKLPKLGWLRMRQSREVVGDLCNATITREGARWFVSLQTEIADVVPAAGLEPTLGLDLGIANFITSSAGNFTPGCHALKESARRLRRYQKSVSRKVKGSNNRRKAVQRLANMHRRIARQRQDWCHKLSTELADQHPVIAMEDLKVANMSRSAAGTVDKPGKNVRQKARLNRTMLDQGWGLFQTMLKYKLQARAGQLVLVPASYTSQTCAECGTVLPRGTR